MLYDNVDEYDVLHSSIIHPERETVSHTVQIGLWNRILSSHGQI